MSTAFNHVYSANEDEYIAAEWTAACLAGHEAQVGTGDIRKRAQETRPGNKRNAAMQVAMNASGRESTVWKLTLAYDGTEFHGWQIQPGRPTIQGTLADAVTAVTGEGVLPQGSGRTDAGVHAWGQVASFSLRAAIPAENLQRALNRILPAAIRILSAEQAPAEFHARHSAVGKVYQYRILHDDVCSPFLARYATCCRWPLDVEAMQEAAEAILGEHDFTSFAASDPDRTARAEGEEAVDGGNAGLASGAGDCEEEALLSKVRRVESNVRRIELSQWSRESLALPLPGTLGAMLAGPDAELFGDTLGGDTGEIFTYTVRGNGFLHHMVRNFVGTFVEIGRGRIPATEIPRILDGRNRALAGPTAAANGLCLMQVLY
jgi:tRNA pseudouridine38-40 synthase